MGHQSSQPWWLGGEYIKSSSSYLARFEGCQQGSLIDDPTTGSVDEEGFASDIIRILDELKITCRFICGRQQTITTREGIVYGYSLMLHELPVDQSILVQQHGMGNNRKIGCGIFIPHKSIKEVSTV